jgi:hypothetical protein
LSHREIRRSLSNLEIGLVMCSIVLSNLQKRIGSFRVPLICHLLANYNVTYFTTYLIRRTRRRGISRIMNFVDDYS